MDTLVVFLSPELQQLIAEWWRVSDHCMLIDADKVNLRLQV